MKKIISILLSFLVVLLTGCSQTDTPESNSSVITTSVTDSQIAENTNSSTDDEVHYTTPLVLRNEFLIEDCVEITTEGSKVFFDNLDRYFVHMTSEYLFKRYPEYKAKTEYLLENCMYFFQNELVQEFYLEQYFAEGSDLKQPYFTTTFKNNSYIDLFETYYSDEAWQYLKRLNDGREYYEETYSLQDGTAVDCILFTVDERTGYVCFKYNEALCALRCKRSTTTRKGKYIFVRYTTGASRYDTFATDSLPELVELFLSQTVLVDAVQYNEYEPFRKYYYDTEYNQGPSPSYLPEYVPSSSE